MDLCNINYIKKILSANGFSFSKALGQNFIIDPEICPEMAKLSGVDKNTLVIEIGTGVGVLTKELCIRAGKVIAIELDKRLLPVLDETLGEYNNLQIINDDVMKVDLKDLIEKNIEHYSSVRICANLPYYITSPIIMMLLEQNLPINSITVMVQKEAGDRLCAEVGSRESGAVTVSVNYYAVAEKLFDVARDCFMPAPNVDSEVINLTIRKEPPVRVVDEDFFFEFIKGAFSQRRKTLVNSISAAFKCDKSLITDALNELKISPTIRAEKLTMWQIGNLTNILYNDLKPQM